MTLKMIDLFSGIGGFSLAGKWAGFETIQFVEKDKFCQKILRKHWPNVPIHDEIKTFHPCKDIDLITGGFPCQGFSVAGKRRGKDDERYLWPEMFRIICESSPAYVLAENVTGIIQIALDDIIMDLEREKYAARVFVLPSSAAQAPHKRERVWVVANRHGKRCDMWCDSWEERFNQENIDRNVSTLQSEWEKLKPESWKTSTANNWLDLNTESVRRNDGVSERLDKDRIKSLGNSIVPQLIFPIMRFIYGTEKFYQ